MYLNYIQLIIGSVCLVIIAYCASVVINAGAIIPYQPLIASLVALAGAMIAYSGTVCAVEKNIKHHQKQKELESIKEKQEIASFAQKILLEIFYYLSAAYRFSLEKDSKEKWLQLDSTIETIEQYIIKLENNLDNFIKLDINNSTGIYSVCKMIRIIMSMPNPDFPGKINKMNLKELENNHSLRGYIEHKFELIKEFFELNMMKNNILDSLDVISKENIDQAVVYKNLLGNIKIIEDKK